MEVVWRIFDAWGSGDWSIGNEYLDQHAVYVISSDFPAFGAFYGLDAIRAFWRDFLQRWERLFTFRGKKIVRMEVVMNHAEALEALALSE